MAAHAPPRRWHFFLLATAWTVFAVYGSLVPLDYRPVELADAIERFRNLPPLWFGLGTRADWVANILLFVPLTFFWMGAFGLFQTSINNEKIDELVYNLFNSITNNREFTVRY